MLINIRTQEQKELINTYNSYKSLIIIRKVFGDFIIQYKTDFFFVFH